ncbi:GNAT family N-acetyltransferase [Deinococcus sp. KSM4-11]|uniref:GNAT family N-acetyltransferase n=1 Tax=Deinococcus sp. KSM4-11 TaxID=2568654 RepID=UPI0010A47636|nr:GNAT family N-acetyltransferase [Deinococcus sp. KSM4-11]THF83618.1 GNAT family N-acetyltransferase [Deinococcus sp. KSM4-11]
MPTLIRPATPDDAPGIAHVHVMGWRETYTGLMPEDFLARMTDDDMRTRRTAMWLDRLSGDRGGVVVATTARGVVGFAAVGPPRDHPGYDAELGALYTLREVHGYGTGRALLQAAAQAAWNGGARNLALWVLDVNPTRAWYARQGAREAGSKTDGPLTEIRMVWDDLGTLI